MCLVLSCREIIYTCYFLNCIAITCVLVKLIVSQLVGYIFFFIDLMAIFLIAGLSIARSVCRTMTFVRKLKIINYGCGIICIYIYLYPLIKCMAVDWIKKKIKKHAIMHQNKNVSIDTVFKVTETFVLVVIK